MNYYTPEEFDKYYPKNFRKLKPMELKTLVTWLESLEVDISDTHLTALMLYFVLDMDVKQVARITKLQHVRGVVELFRFRCKQYLDREKDVCNEDIRRSLCQLVGSSEIILVRKGRGICLFSGNVYSEAAVIGAVEDSQYLAGVQ